MNIVHSVLIKDKAVKCEACKLELYVKHDWRVLRTSVNFKCGMCATLKSSPWWIWIWMLDVKSLKKSNGLLFKEARNAAFNNCCPQDLCEMSVLVLEYGICCTCSGQHLLCGLSSLKCLYRIFFFILKFCRFILWIFLLKFHINLYLWFYCSFQFFSVYRWLIWLTIYF